MRRSARCAREGRKKVGLNRLNSTRFDSTQAQTVATTRIMTAQMPTPASASASSPLRVILCTNSEQIRAAFVIRIDVFVVEQGFTAEAEIDEHDAGSAHFLVVDGESDTPLGTCRWVPYPLATPSADQARMDPTSPGDPLSMDELKTRFLKAGHGKLGRLALTKAARGRGAGAQIVRESEAWLCALLKGDGGASGEDDSQAAHRRKVSLRLHGQMPVVPFYER